MNKCVLFLLCVLSLNKEQKPKVDYLGNSYAYAVFYDYKAQLNREDSTKLLREQMILLLKDEESLFLSFNRYLADSILMVQEQNPQISNAASLSSPQNNTQARVQYYIKKSFPDRKYCFVSTLGVQRFYYYEDLFDFNWQLLEGEKEILGYRCLKAATKFAGRDYTAWYTIDIPVVDGPYKFNGLPGLILSIEDALGHYSFTATGIENTARKMDKPLIGSRYKKLKDEKEFKSLVKKFKENPAVYFEPENMKLPPEMIEKAAKNAIQAIKFQNNPLELDER